MTFRSSFRIFMDFFFFSNLTYCDSSGKNWSEFGIASQIHLLSGGKTLPMAPPHPTSTARPGVPTGSHVPGTNCQGAAGDGDRTGDKAQPKVHPRDRQETRAGDRPTCNISP